MENSFDYENASNNLKRFIGDNPEKVVIYTTTKKVSASGLNRDILAFIIQDNEIYNIGFGKVYASGMDAGFHCVYNIFMTAYPSLPYQKFLTHRWL